MLPGSTEEKLMAHTYKREGSEFWSYEFYFSGKRYRKCTDQTNRDAALDMMSAHRTSLAKGEAGFRERKRVTLSDFLKNDFLPFVKSKFRTKLSTLRYYSYGAGTLQASDFATLDLLEVNDQHAAQYAAKHSALSPSTVNCGLRTLRRALALAYQWGKLDKPAKITLAKGEKQRERVLGDAEAEAYLAACPQPWRDAATVMLGTGLRPSEVFSLRWERIHLNGKGGMLQISDGKSKAAKRMLPMVPRVYATLKARHDDEETGWVFPADTPSGHLEGYSAKNQHAVAIKNARLNDKPLKVFPHYTLRHTALTNLGTSGCDVFTLAKIAGHSSITTTQKYIHPQADAIERAFAALPESVLVAV